jgi:hypothetical protein
VAITQLSSAADAGRAMFSFTLSTTAHAISTDAITSSAASKSGTLSSCMSRL